ncbi:HAD hydrolase-like protein [Anaerofustis sp.]|uniref:HAD hydrolase-like protein n=1 Tax=Anaerofustis sp. TaxID=1872517 RepID=UPI0025BB9C0C|nr:HAD hydrolase-like protein [Anaerofustis sp.]
MKYNYVIFDLDGTILDSHEGICRCFQKALKAYGVDESVENIRKLLGPPLSKTIITKYGFSKEDGAAAMKIHMKRLKEKGIYECKIYDEIPLLLKTLHEQGVKMAIATNKPEEASVLQLKHFKLAKYFEIIVGNNWTQTRGTKGDFIRMSMEHMKVEDKSKVCMVGDRYNDLEGGVENGLDTIGVTYGYGSKEEIEDCKPTYIANSPMDITKIVLK